MGVLFEAARVFSVRAAGLLFRALCLDLRLQGIAFGVLVPRAQDVVVGAETSKRASLLKVRSQEDLAPACREKFESIKAVVEADERAFV